MCQSNTSLSESLLPPEPDDVLEMDELVTFVGEKWFKRWYNTLRQWVGRYTRRTLSFSKEDRYHELVTRWFILQHNLMIRDASRTM